MYETLAHRFRSPIFKIRQHGSLQMLSDLRKLHAVVRLPHDSRVGYLEPATTNDDDTILGTLDYIVKVALCPS